LGLAIAVTLRPKSRRTGDHILGSDLRIRFLSVASYDSQGYGGGILSTCTRCAIDSMSLTDIRSHATEKIPKPPPIYVYGVVDFKKMLDKLATVLEEETYR
jgi:hypothetical protein